jgi:hypothetical protein
MHTRGVPKTYSREEADEILRQALMQQAADGIAHEDLVAAAREVGIPEAAIESAAERLGEHRLLKERVEYLRAEKRRSFAHHLLTFLIVNGCIFAFDYFDRGPWFFHFPLIIWGMVLLLVGMRKLAPSEEKLVRRAERDLQRQRRRDDRQRRRTQPAAAAAAAKEKIPGAAKEFEAAVTEGVSAMMHAAAHAIRNLTPAQKRYRADEAGGDEGTPETEAEGESRRQRRV